MSNSNNENNNLTEKNEKIGKLINMITENLPMKMN